MKLIATHAETLTHYENQGQHLLTDFTNLINALLKYSHSDAIHEEKHREREERTRQAKMIIRQLQDMELKKKKSKEVTKEYGLISKEMMAIMTDIKKLAAFESRK